MITWNFHVGCSQGNLMYNFILGYDILSELQIGICFYNNTITLNWGAYEGWTDPMKDVKNINFSKSSAWIHKKNVMNDYGIANIYWTICDEPEFQVKIYVILRLGEWVLSFQFLKTRYQSRIWLGTRTNPQGSAK